MVAPLPELYREPGGCAQKVAFKEPQINADDADQTEERRVLTGSTGSNRIKFNPRVHPVDPVKTLLSSV
jgi:hypothetical protein